MCTYANDLRYYSSTELPEYIKLDRAIHILENYGQCCDLHRTLTIPSEQVLSKHCEPVTIINDGGVKCEKYCRPGRRCAMITSSSI